MKTLSAADRGDLDGLDDGVFDVEVEVLEPVVIDVHGIEEGGISGKHVQEMRDRDTLRKVDEVVLLDDLKSDEVVPLLVVLLDHVDDVDGVAAQLF